MGKNFVFWSSYLCFIRKAIYIPLIKGILIVYHQTLAFEVINTGKFPLKREGSAQNNYKIV